MSVGGRKGHQARQRAERRLCPHCNRSNALINWTDELAYCRWSRENQCDFTVNQAMKERDDLLQRHGFARRFGTQPTT